MVTWCYGTAQLFILTLTLNFLVTVVSMFNSSKEILELSFESADVKSHLLLQTKDEKPTVNFFSACVETKLCKSRTSFTSHLHSWCGMVWYTTLRVNQNSLSIVVYWLPNPLITCWFISGMTIFRQFCHIEMEVAYQLAISSSHSILTPGQPVLALIPQCQT